MQDGEEEGGNELLWQLIKMPYYLTPSTKYGHTYVTAQRFSEGGSQLARGC